MHTAALNGGGDTSWKDSYKTATMITLPDVMRVCGQQAGQLVQELARGVGCPEEFILMPLLTCCSALMGHRSEIRVHSAWSEPPVLWMIVGATPGSRKSAALRQVLMPLLALTEDKVQQQQLGLQPEQHDVEHLGLNLPVVFTDTMNKQQLQTMLHDRGGGVLHVTERLEESHQALEMHALLKEKLTASQPHLHDLYEAFAGNMALPPTPVNRNTENPDTDKFSSLSQTVSYNQCGFASPEYVVNLTVKAPNWLSGRFLVSCPAVNESSFTMFNLPLDEDSSDNEAESSCEPPTAKKMKKAKRLTLKDVYKHAARVHRQNSPRNYVFTKDAVQELRRFQEEEWCTIVNQLGSEDNGGLVGKSLGQIVRLAGVLKALTEASKHVDDSDICSSETVQDADTNVRINCEDVARAVELGKYFLEQKLSMTFMVSTGFFRSSSSSRQSQGSVPPAPTPQSSSEFPFMPPNPSSMNTLYGFPKVPMNPPSSSMGGIPVASAAVPQRPAQHPQPGHATSLHTSMQNHNFPFNLLAHHQGPPGFHMMGDRNNGLPSFPSTSNPRMATASPSSNPEIDVTQLPATWIPTTPEEEIAEMSQAAEFAHLEPSQFVAIHARRVKRLLECFDDGCGVSATTAAQKSIAPPVRVAGTNNRHPAWASALFFQKVEDLGLGLAEQVRHPTNGRVYWRFKRKPMSELTEKNMQLLQYLRIDMVRYTRMGQPTLNVPGLELEAVPGIDLPERSIVGEEIRTSNAKENSDNSPVTVNEIKQELILD